MPSTVVKRNWVTTPMPEGWEDGSDVLILGRPEGGFRPNCVITKEARKQNETVAEFAARQLPQLREALMSYSVVHEGSTRFGNNAGFLREHTFRMETGEVAQLQFYTLSGDMVCIITFTHLLGRLDSVKPLAELFFSETRPEPA